ncbi:PREDICTED: dipeptidyl peptidase 3 isoform X1 [Polistes dominula]|uniref:Dipeptidyl peptidase 3 n=2 Tax=Polistes dominula TaxID=743375 RepID=A0ABM1HUM4_POLDO|nr:PREDICTED: dipeptidyl peptidase 3 isoform X1 [Polistes dominula]
MFKLFCLNLFIRSNSSKLNHISRVFYSTNTFKVHTIQSKRSRRYYSYNKMSDDMSLYTLPNNQPLVLLECETSFNALTLKEKLYAHYLSKAAWHGGLIVNLQLSPESPLIFALLHKIFLSESADDLKLSAKKAGISDDDFTAFLVYACGIITNSGNYKSFGDSKIIPNLPKEKFETIVKVSKAFKNNSDEIQYLWDNIHNLMFSLENKLRSLGLGDKGVTTYFSANCTDEDAQLVNKFMQSKGLESYNTRCFKTIIPSKDSKTDEITSLYEIRLASVDKEDDPKITLPQETFEEEEFKITRGDYDIILAKVNDNLQKAKEYAANETENQMIEKFISHFKTGSLKDHKDGSRYWIKDKGPVIETYIGFIETYRDPAGQRAEFEGFVAMVNKEMSQKFAKLVNRANEFIPSLPWGKDFERVSFTQPDFTSLEVLTFSSSGIPAGINIPNYDEIRQSEGFKNVSLGNVIPANMKQDEIPFLSNEDVELLNKYRIPSFELQVGLHELLGHGSGKLLRSLGANAYNFDKGNLINPLTGDPVDKYFMPGETYDSKFGAMGSSYEECRAEAVGLYLCLDKSLVRIFECPEEAIDDIIYVNWLSLLWNGCAKALEMYDPSTKKWLQAHSQARYVLLRVCLEAKDSFVTVTETEEGKDLRMTLDRSKIETSGKEVIGEFLKKLQIYKSTGDVDSAREMYEKYSEVPDSGPYPWARWRKIVLLNKQCRKMFVQPNTFIKNENGNTTDVILKNYEPTFSGLIQSWIERYPSADISDSLIDLWKKDKKHFVLENTD